jgi:hypothetical protein
MIRTSSMFHPIWTMHYSSISGPSINRAHARPLTTIQSIGPGHRHRVPHVCTYIVCGYMHAPLRSCRAIPPSRPVAGMPQSARPTDLPVNKGSVFPVPTLAAFAGSGLPKIHFNKLVGCIKGTTHRQMINTSIFRRLIFETGVMIKKYAGCSTAIQTRVRPCR